MKRIQLSPTLIVMLIILTFVCCGKHDDELLNNDSPSACTEKQKTDQVTINGFDYNPYSPYFQQAVCTFKIKKNTVERSNCATQPLMECQNFISIKNLTPYNLSFSYTLHYMLNAYNWQYQNTVSIAPGAETDFEYMNDNCGSLQLGKITIASPQIRYN